MPNTSFSEIYSMAITELKDPHLKKIYVENEILFSQVMYNYLTNAIPLFTNPFQAAMRLKKRTEPTEYSQKYSVEQVTDEFVLDVPVPEEELENTIFVCLVDGERMDGKYNAETSTFTTETEVTAGSIVDISYYYTGEFLLQLYDQEKYILSQWVAACWSESENNDQMDIARLLGDDDFKLSSNATTTQAKVTWNIVNKETAMKRMSKFAWDASMLGLYR